jgi:hypothetical protein
MGGGDLFPGIPDPGSLEIGDARDRTPDLGSFFWRSLSCSVSQATSSLHVELVHHQPDHQEHCVRKCSSIYSDALRCNIQFLLHPHINKVKLC